MPSTYIYDFDPAGTNAANRIVNEDHSVVAAAGKNLSYIVPRAAPFFRNSVSLVKVVAGIETPLTEGVDFVFVFRYAEASIQTSQSIYGGIAFLNRSFAGTVRLKQYQTIGDNWVLDDHTALESLTENLYSVRTVMWDQLVQYPVTFPPYNHDHSADDSTGYSALLDKMDEVIAQLAIPDTDGASALMLLHTSSGTAHTPAQVGLSNVPNFAKANSAQAIAGSRDDLFMTPAMTKAVMDSAPGATGTKTFALEGDVTASAAFNVGGTWPSFAVTLKDAFKAIDTRTYPVSADRGPDPDTTTLPCFITNHTNSPAGASGVLADAVTRPQFFIFNVLNKTGAGDSNLYARAQLAIEHRATKTDGVQRVFVRYRELNSPYAWAAWTLISGQDLFTGYGRTSSTPDTLRLPVVKVTLASTTKGLPAGTYLVFSYFDLAAGAVIDANTPRFQIATTLTADVKAQIYMRHVANESSAGQWLNASGAASTITTTDIAGLFAEGEYDQAKTTATDLTTIGYPANVKGRLIVARLGNGTPTTSVADGITQTYHAFDDLRMWVRRYGTTAWGAWVLLRAADGSVPASSLATVPAALGGGNDTATAEDIRTAIGCGSIAEWNIIVSDVDPGTVPAKTLWFSSL